jgi:hypothetical protein
VKTHRPQTAAAATALLLQACRLLPWALHPGCLLLLELLLLPQPPLLLSARLAAASAALPPPSPTAPAF